jgi:ubiquitin C-terminal hydrolase
MAIDWHPSTLVENYNPIVSEVVEHASVNLELDDNLGASNYTSLDDCIAKFHKPEILENEMRCKKCSDLTPHIKKLEIFMPPPILIIQLKRFR